MKQIGSRRERPMTVQASGALLADGARFCEAVCAFSPTTFVPKGVYRYRSHDAANRHQQDCLARGMSALAAQRR